MDKRKKDKRSNRDLQNTTHKTKDRVICSPDSSSTHILWKGLPSYLGEIPKNGKLRVGYW